MYVFKYKCGVLWIIAYMGVHIGWVDNYVLTSKNLSPSVSLILRFVKPVSLLWKVCYAHLGRERSAGYGSERNFDNSACLRCPPKNRVQSIFVI